MNSSYEEFMKLLDSENKETAVEYILSRLKSQSTDIVTLYTRILGPALNNWECDHEKNSLCIWREHIRSSIVRTVVECVYPYVLKERKEVYKLKNNKKVAVVCPPYELHEIGIRMVSDFFTIAGYNTTYVGSNTPADSFIEALRKNTYDYVAIGVTNYYNLFKTQKLVEQIKQTNPETKIIVGGLAFDKNREFCEKLAVYKCIRDFEEILELGRGEPHEA